jgi:hypothetical protein
VGKLLTLARCVNPTLLDLASRQVANKD